MSFLQVEHGEIYYEDHGAGYPVLLFAPGFLSSRIERWSINPAVHDQFGTYGEKHRERRQQVRNAIREAAHEA